MKGLIIMMHRKVLFVYLSVALLACVSLGCGSDGPATVKVSGTVTLDGTPVADASVNFVPADGGRPASGFTDAAGKYTLTTITDGDGALIGQHGIAVMKIEGSGKATAGGEEEFDDFVEEEGEEYVEKHLLPVKYSNPATSGLSADVQKGMGPVDLALTSSED